jgi:DNA-directed RNA polymerase specialized sigma subunit
MGQRETAKALGVSQMQISRMERRVLARLRELTERWQTLN